MSLNNRNRLIVAPVHVGSISTDTTIPVLHLPKKVYLETVHLLNGASIGADDGNFCNLKLMSGATVVAELDTRAANQGAITANVAKAMAIVSGQETVVADTDLSLVYDETEGLQEITTITVPTGMVGADLDQKGFLIYDDIGSVGFWFDIDAAGGSEPTALAAADARAVKINTIGAADNATTIATKIAAAMDADAKYIAAVDGTLARKVNVTASIVGTRVDVADGTGGEATGLTFAVSQQGVAVVAKALTNAKLILGYSIW